MRNACDECGPENRIFLKSVHTLFLIFSQSCGLSFLWSLFSSNNRYVLIGEGRNVFHKAPITVMFQTSCLQHNALQIISVFHLAYCRKIKPYCKTGIE